MLWRAANENKLGRLALSLGRRSPYWRAWQIARYVFEEWQKRQEELAFSFMGWQLVQECGMPMRPQNWGNWVGWSGSKPVAGFCWTGQGISAFVPWPGPVPNENIRGAHVYRKYQLSPARGDLYQYWGRDLPALPGQYPRWYPPSPSAPPRPAPKPRRLPRTNPEWKPEADPWDPPRRTSPSAPPSRRPRPGTPPVDNPGSPGIGDPDNPHPWSPGRWNVPTPWRHIPSRGPNPWSPPPAPDVKDLPARGVQRDTTVKFEEDSKPEVNTETRPVTRKKPPPGTKEKKFEGSGEGIKKFFRHVSRGKEFLSEVDDFIDVLYDALPKKRQNLKGRKTPQDKLKKVYDHFDEIDWTEAAKNWVENYIEDKVIGTALDKSNKAAIRRGETNTTSSRAWLRAGGR